MSSVSVAGKRATPLAKLIEEYCAGLQPLIRVSVETVANVKGLPEQFA